MSSIDPTLPWRQVLLALQADKSATFGAFASRFWPDGAQEHLEGEGILVPIGRAESVVCEECAEYCTVESCMSNDGSGFVAWCLRGEHGLLSLDAAALRRWRVSAQGLATWLSRQLRGNSPKTIGLDLWEVGSRAWPTRVLFAASIPESKDCALSGFVASLRKDTRVVLMVPASGATPSGLPEQVEVQPLTSLLEVEQGKVVLDPVTVSTWGDVHKDVEPVAVPPGTRWEAVTMRVLDEERVQMAVGTEVQVRTYRDLGMCDLRGGSQPTDVWYTLLQFARGAGRVGDEYGSREYLGPVKALGRSRVWALRKALKAVIEAEGTPIREYRRGRGWETTFVISWDG